MKCLNAILLLLGALASYAAAASAPTFCKCTCFTNSTIIEIKPHPKTPSGSNSKPQQPAADSPVLPPPSSNAGHENGNPNDDTSMNHQLHLFSHKRAGAFAAAASCSQCNKAFCLGQSLPICKDAGEKDVVTMCFQRDSRKDQIIVWGFLLGTAGLLGWAGVQKVIEMRGRAGVVNLGRTAAGGGGGGGGAGGSHTGIQRRQPGASGSDAARGAYTHVSSHSRESSSLG